MSVRKEAKSYYKYLGEEENKIIKDLIDYHYKLLVKINDQLIPEWGKNAPVEFDEYEKETLGENLILLIQDLIDNLQDHVEN